MAKLFKFDANKISEKGKICSVNFCDLYFQQRKNLIKNYIISPDIKTINS